MKPKNELKNQFDKEFAYNKRMRELEENQKPFREIVKEENNVKFYFCAN